jgi:hypothetical protein
MASIFIVRQHTHGALQALIIPLLQLIVVKMQGPTGLRQGLANPAGKVRRGRQACAGSKSPQGATAGRQAEVTGASG